MPPVKHSEAEETAFMSALLGGIDDSFWNAVPTPTTSPIKSKISRNPCTPNAKPRPARPSPYAKPKPTNSRHTPSKVYSAGNVDFQSLLDGAEDWDLDDMELDSPKKKSPKKSAKPISVSAETSYTREHCTRCIVESIVELEASHRWQKQLTVKVDPGNERRQVILQDDWAPTDVRIGDTINVVGPFTPISPSSSSSISSTISITSKSNLLILHPDILITATALSNATQCRRRPLLSALVRSTSDATPSLLWGNMLHEVMQICLASGRWDDTWIEEKVAEMMTKNLAELVKINVGVDVAKMEVMARAKGLRKFSERYISDTPKPSAVLSNTRSGAHQAPSLLAISQLLDVEEDIWSPTYGLKGKLDATVNAIISDPSPTQGVAPAITAGPKPFEIKTGRTIAGMEHRAQTMLYTLLASERYGVEVPSGLLYYTQSDEVVRVPTSRNEVRGLFGVRNELAGYMMRRQGNEGWERNEGQEVGDVEGEAEPFLPATVDDERACKKCYAVDKCMLYRRATEAPMDTSSPIYDTYQLKTGHLTNAQAAFFKKWENLISLEERDLIRFKKELWTMGALDREKRGRCFAGMVFDASFCPPPQIEEKTGGSTWSHKFIYQFTRSQHWFKEGSSGSLLSGQMVVGDAITISVEPHLLALGRGFILELSPKETVIGLEHALSVKAISDHIGLPPDEVIFRIDKDELFTGMGRIRDNLAQLFYAEGETRKLRLVVDLQPPRFSELADIPPAVQQHTKKLNEHQQRAISKVLSAEDYALILGMPGTGKTTVIAALIHSLVEMGKTVLLTSYTHSAVDTILQKLDGAEFGILRLGNEDKIHPDVLKYTLATRKTASSVEQLEIQLMTPPVVATTCLSVDHALFHRRKFDYCIVDEASQITLPSCLGPLRFAETFVLVGDHFQLPPLVKTRAARKGGFDVSLFRRLSDAHPGAVVDLTYQYRMNQDIMLLSNKLIYDNRLLCGSDEVAARSLALADRAFLNRLHAGKSPCAGNSLDKCWIERLASESCKAIFVDTDLLPAPERHVGDFVQNDVEANLVVQLTETLLRCGVTEDRIGIITLYRQQVKLLSHLLQSRKEIEILTADRSQGRDKDCIIISMVKSNDTSHVGDLVKDWRRINVSFTRARSKLVIVGSRKTLTNCDLLSQFFELMESKNWILQLPAGADKLHVVFEPCPSSTPAKRTAQWDKDSEHLPTSVSGKENVLPVTSSESERPLKKLKEKRAGVDEGLMRGRPILRDLVHEIS